MKISIFRLTLRRLSATIYGTVRRNALKIFCARPRMIRYYFMNNITISEIAGGLLFSFPTGTPLPEELLTPVRNKWEATFDEGEFDKFAARIMSSASPKAFLKPAVVNSVGSDGDESAVIGGITFHGKLLPEKLSSLVGKNVYCYVMSCGIKLHELAISSADPVDRAVTDELSLAYLSMIRREIQGYAEENYYPGVYFTSMNPGSIGAFPLSEQIPLFELLGDGARLAEVTLTDSLLMVPFKSGSGIFFSAEKKFESCMYCERLSCPNRRAPRIQDDL